MTIAVVNNYGWNKITSICSTLIFLLATLTLTPALADWQTVTEVSVSKSDRYFDRSNRVYFTENHITNNSTIALSNSTRLVVINPSHPVTNAEGLTDAGNAYFNILADGDTLPSGAASKSTRINFKRIRGAFSYTLLVEQLVSDTPKDSDNDGIPDSEDSCPLDPDNDSDSDGICGDIDTCPLDPDNDIDNDNICGNVDQCPTDALNDVDGDGICGAEDICPNDKDNACITITGQIFGDGSVIANAFVKVGTSSDVNQTDALGNFTATPGATELGNDGISNFFPVEVTASGFASGHAKVILISGKVDYDLIVKLKGISTTITDQEDVTQGVAINNNLGQVGSLMIPEAALPTGVTKVTGKITYLDPATDDIESAPGGDLLALPENADPNDPPVPLESFGMMEFDLIDQNGNPVTELESEAEVCMKADPTMSAGDIVPLWHYDENKGLWIEEGQGTVEQRGEKLMICGGVNHFTWWNYDRPIEQHACFKFHFINEADNSSLTGALDWQAEGVTYNGLSPERICSRDNNDPVTPLPNSKIDSVTVKRSSNLFTEQIRLFTNISGSKYYLVADGDGTYSLTIDLAKAKVFDNPKTNASCIRDTNISECEFLDYLDINNGNADGILPLAIDGINLPPIISEFKIDEVRLAPGGQTGISVKVTDPEGTDVKLTWSTSCFGSSGTDETITSETTTGISGATFKAQFKAPTNLKSLLTFCTIDLSTRDSDEQFSNAQQQVTINLRNEPLMIEGIMFGTDGLPLPLTEISIINFSDDGSILAKANTDNIGKFELELSLDNCNSIECIGSLFLRTEFSFNTNLWIANKSLTKCFFGNGGLNIEQKNTACNIDFRIPTTWGPLSGNLYPAAESDSRLSITSQISNGFLILGVSVDPQSTSFGPIMVPVGNGALAYLLDASTFWGRPYFMLSKVGLQADAGDATGQAIITVFDNSGNPSENYSLNIHKPNSTTFETVTTDINGVISIASELGQVSVLPTNSDGLFTSAQGIIDKKNQQIFIDINSQRSCTVSGVAYDNRGQPWPNINFSIGSSNFLNRKTAVTNSLGQFTIDGIFPGLISVQRGNVISPNIARSFHIDNCRPNGNIPREIIIDLPFFEQ